MLIAIDASVEHGDALAAGAINGARVIMLEPKREAIAQITQALYRHPAKSLHIVTHGSPGCLHFSSGDVTFANLHYYAADIESWFDYRSASLGSKVKTQDPDAFLSLYACNLATGDAGSEFLENLHHLVGVSVHASNSKVGSMVQGASWQLKVSYPFPRQAKFPFTDDLLETYDAVL